MDDLYYQVDSVQYLAHRDVLMQRQPYIVDGRCRRISGRNFEFVGRIYLNGQRTTKEQLVEMLKNNQELQDITFDNIKNRNQNQNQNQSQSQSQNQNQSKITDYFKSDEMILDEIDNNDEYKDFHPRVAKLYRRKRIKNESNEWQNLRRKLITGTNIAPILGVKGAFQSQKAIFKTKTGRENKSSMPDPTIVGHGIFYECEVSRLFEQVTKLELVSEECGLVKNEPGRFEMFAATPDYVCKYIAALVEIKCPYSGKINLDKVPDRYYAQIQWQLEICDIDMCFYVEYLPPCLMFGDGTMNIIIIKRDKEWFLENVSKIMTFWDEVETFYKKENMPLGAEMKKFQDEVEVVKHEKKTRKRKALDTAYSTKPLLIVPNDTLSSFNRCHDPICLDLSSVPEHNL